MARDAQAVTIGETSSPDNTRAEYIQLVGGGVGVYPFSRMSFRGSFALDGSGVGDTADCRITLPLPSNVVWQLDQFGLSMEGGAGYTNNLLEMYIAPSSTEFGASTQVNYPLAVGTGISPIGTDTYRFLTPGAQLQNASAAAIGGGIIFDDPYRVITFNDSSSGADPVIWLGSDTTTNVASGTVRLSINFLGYTFEQMSSAALWTGFNTRG